ncbi:MULTISPECIES: winged helix DNA-binding protein [Bacteroidaceae]|uniref:MarR family winged helix-turn-helix transcriptional regulator n=1 Tax=Bacteroidaceae TaxID=815 RepID=UPI0025D7B25E|nr:MULTISPECIES: winged helix DNA-binding protein [Bacteroidaceae]
MEKIKCICVMRELLKALSELENQLITTYGISLNEAMVLCSIGSETVAAGTIVERTGMTPSHASKTISLIEKKEMVTRDLGKQDKRQMYFTLTDKAKACLEEIKQQGVDIPQLLQPLFDNYSEAM